MKSSFWGGKMEERINIDDLTLNKENRLNKKAGYFSSQLLIKVSDSLCSGSSITMSF